MKAIYLKKGKEKSPKRFHPWIFSGAIKSQLDLDPGEIIRVLDHQGNFLAIGYYTEGSISIRLLSFEDLSINDTFWTDIFKRAYQFRQKLNVFNKSTTAYRLINGEGDYVPGLIVDVYDKYIIVQYHNNGIEHLGPYIKDGISNVKELAGKSIIEKLPSYRRQEAIDNIEEKATVQILENDLSFHIDLITGQKTGFFLDQRPNRELLEQYAKGLKVCNLFSYTGGFSLYALRAGAQEVCSIDISQAALDICEKNIELNNLQKNHTTKQMDIMKSMKELELSEYDVLIVDPPAFAKSMRKKHQATKAYIRLNASVFSKAKSGSLIFSFSCSQVIDMELFSNSIRSAAIQAKRKIKILKKLGAGMDHPVNMYHTEGHYLKGLMLKIEE